VSVAQLTSARRAAAFGKAAAARRARALLKDRLRRGHVNVEQLLRNADLDEVLGRMKVCDLLATLPAVGKVRAREIMTELGFAPTRRLRGLGDGQRKSLLDKLAAASGGDDRRRLTQTGAGAG